MIQSPFDHNKFLGYICDVTPQYVRIQFPSAKLLHTFYLNGQLYPAGNVGSYVIIEGEEYGFLGHLFEQNLSQGEKIELNERDLHYDNSKFHPIAKIELLASFNIYNPEIIIKTISHYPTIGAKVYSCSNEQMEIYISKFGQKSKDEILPIAKLGNLTMSNVPCRISVNSLFGRHCAVLGTTGGGKSWTVAKLLELMSQSTGNKCILIDATGEYAGSYDEQEVITIRMGTSDCIFSYRKLSIDDMYYLLRPSSRVQVPKLMEAIRSLKMIEIDKNNELGDYYTKDSNNNFIKHNLNKVNVSKRKYEEFQYRHIEQIEDNSCNFEFNNLSRQITNECVWDNNDRWGYRNDTDVSNCVSLIARVSNLMAIAEYNNIFAFRSTSGTSSKDLTDVIDEFINGEKSIMCIDFSNVSFDYQVREILVNAIGKYLLTRARNGDFTKNPITIFIDEAHQFLNKTIADEYFLAKPLNSFEQISKEARKYGLFLCIATQMPRDIPLGTLSQIGTFIVHRLINEYDKKAIENAASSANRNCLSFLPVLGEGEALLVGVDFPMPLIIKIDEPIHKPKSITPKLNKR